MKIITAAKSPDRDWLKTYYYLRFAVSAIWVALAFTVARSMPPLAAVMLVAYPAWDALANYLDASRSGGMTSNKSQMLNFVVSIVTAIVVVATLPHGMHAVLQIFGVWAVLSGLFQLLTGVGRWKSYGAQWAMILSGAQSGSPGHICSARPPARHRSASPTWLLTPPSVPSTSSSRRFP
ncbi:MAG: DUF308 domain-containing protein [Sphingomonas sp.]